MVAPSKRNCRIAQRIARAPRRALGAHTRSLCSRNVTVWQVVSGHIRLFIIEGVGVVGGVGRVVAGYGSRSSDDGDCHTVHLKDLDMSNTIFDRPDLSAFTRLDGLGLEVTGQRIEADHAVLACRITGEDRWCRRCGCQGVARDTVVRRLAHEPYGWRPTILHVSVRRYRCQGCSHVWRQDMSQAADPRAKLSRAAVRWALTGLVVHHLTVARIAQALGVSWKSR